MRPRKIKTVNHDPKITYFKPSGVPLKELEEVEITLDELETLRLSCLEKKSQTDAAKNMDVHQSTFQRTLTRARDKIADALVNGKAVKIQGGEYKMPNKDGTGPIGNGQGRGQDFGRRMGQGKGLGQGMAPRGRMNGPLVAGPEGKCICQKCKYEQAHIRGQPCNKIKCPKCESLMTRGN